MLTGSTADGWDLLQSAWGFDGKISTSDDGGVGGAGQERWPVEEKRGVDVKAAERAVGVVSRATWKLRAMGEAVLA